MAHNIRLRLAEQLAEAIQHVSKSAPQDVNKLAWCFRCSSATKKSNEPVHKFVVGLRHLMACGAVPSGSFEEWQKWSGKVASQVTPTNLVKNIQPQNNVFLIEVDKTLFRKEVLQTVYASKDKYGTSSILHEYRETDAARCIEWLPRRQKVLMEYSSPNIAKPFHAGHLRSTIIGNFIANIYQALDHKTIRINYLGDWGKQFGLLGVGYQKYGSNTAMSLDAMHHLFDIYVKINQDAKGPDGEQINKAAMDFCRRLEDGDPSAKALWQYCKDSSITDYNKVYERLGVHFNHYEGESQYQEHCDPLVAELNTRGLLQLRGDPPVSYVDLSTPDNPSLHANILKNDGTTLYVTRDIAAALDRKERYHFDKVHYIVENGQHLHFKQLIGVLKKMGCDWAERCEEDWHVKFGRVDGMSTRRGNVVFLKDILDEAQSRMLDNIKNAKTTKVTENLDHVADRLGVSAILVQDLKERRLRNYKFSWERATTFSGDTGVYLQYAHSRLCSLERSCGLSLDPECELGFLTELSASSLIQHIAKFDQCLQECISSLESCHLTNYLFQLCHLTNVALEELRVKDEPGDIAQARLMLFTCARITLGNGLRLLGVQPLKRM